MEVEYIARQILRELEGMNLHPTERLAQLRDSLKQCKKESTDPQTANHLLETAKSSGYTLFRLIGRANYSGNPWGLMEWCDKMDTFTIMCPNKVSVNMEENYGYNKRTYTLEELPNVIRKALEWHNDKREKLTFSPIELHIQAVG